MPVAKDLTELVEINPVRVDRVKTPASGFPVLIMKSAAKDVDKKGNVNEAPDISNAEAVLRLLAGLIQSEAREMEAGNWDEICDIEMLTNAAYMIKCFRRIEMSAADDSLYKSLESAIAGRANELGVPDPMSQTAPEVAKTEDPTPTPIPTTDVTPPVEKSLDERIEEAVAKQVAPLAERNKALEDELAAIKALPVPGGPAVSAAPAQVTAEKSKANAAEADRYERLSKDVQDRDQARFYAEKARELRAS